MLSDHRGFNDVNNRKAESDDDVDGAEGNAAGRSQRLKTRMS